MGFAMDYMGFHGDYRTADICKTYGTFVVSLRFVSTFMMGFADPCWFRGYHPQLGFHGGSSGSTGESNEISPDQPDLGI